MSKWHIDPRVALLDLPNEIKVMISNRVCDMEAIESHKEKMRPILFAISLWNNGMLSRDFEQADRLERLERALMTRDTFIRNQHLIAYCPPIRSWFIRRGPKKTDGVGTCYRIADFHKAIAEVGL